jgi:hypothetical protein
MDPAVFAVLLTAAGAPIGSALIWAAIDFIKSSPAKALVAGHEKLAAFIGSALIVVVAYVVGFVEEPPRYSAAAPLDLILIVGAGLLAFYNIGRLAMAVHDDVNRYPNSLTTDNGAV